MATITDFNKLSKRERHNRYFSEDFKRKKVSEIDRNIATIAEIVRDRFIEFFFKQGFRVEVKYSFHRTTNITEWNKHQDRKTKQ